MATKELSSGNVIAWFADWQLSASAEIHGYTFVTRLYVWETILVEVG